MVVLFGFSSTQCLLLLVLFVVVVLDDFPLRLCAFLKLLRELVFTMRLVVVVVLVFIKTVVVVSAF